jgi:hypothetical protein
MRTPKSLMKNTVKHWTATWNVVSGGNVPTWTLVNRAIPCSFQEAQSELVTAYKERSMVCNASIFLVDPVAYAAIGTDDYIVYGNNNFRVISKIDEVGMGRVFRIDAKEVVSGPV